MPRRESKEEHQSVSHILTLATGKALGSLTLSRAVLERLAVSRTQTSR